MLPVSEIIGTGCSCYYAHGVWNPVCMVCVCSHLPSSPQKEKRHKVKMPCASVLKCQSLTSVVDVWEGEFDMQKYVFCSASGRQNLYIELTLNKETKRNPIGRNYCLAAVLVVLSANAQDKKNNRPTSYNTWKESHLFKMRRLKKPLEFFNRETRNRLVVYKLNECRRLIPYLNVSPVRTHVIFNNHFCSTR